MPWRNHMNSRRLTSVATAGFLVALLLGLGLPAVPAVAVETIPTTTTVTVSGGSAVGDQVTVTAQIASAAGVPTGTVRFWDGSKAISEEVPVDAAGIASTVWTVDGYGLIGFRATFEGSDGFADSSGQALWFGLRVMVVLTPEPFMTRPNPFQVRYALVARATRTDGRPIPGLVLEFTHGSAVSPDLLDMRPPGSKLACGATTDANGVARCGPLQSLSALQSKQIWVAHQRTGAHEFSVASIPLR